jgi:hypothetical protein
VSQTNQTAATLRSEEIRLTDEDRAIYFHRLGETARNATRAEFAEPGELTADARLMLSITRWTHADPDMPLTRLMGRLYRQEQERGS